MNPIKHVVRWWSPLRYARWSLANDQRQNSKRLKESALTGLEWENLRDSLDSSLQEWHEWITEMEEARLERRAARMGVYLEDLDLPPGQMSHRRRGSFGNHILTWESHKALTRATRDREPIYRKERREVVELWLKAGAFVIAVLGAATGFIAVLKK